MSQFAAPDSLHIYPILIDKPNAKSQSVFPVHWWTEKSKKLSFWAGGLSNLSPIFSLTQDRQLRRLIVLLYCCFSLPLFRKTPSRDKKLDCFGKTVSIGHKFLLIYNHVRIQYYAARNLLTCSEDLVILNINSQLWNPLF